MAFHDDSDEKKMEDTSLLELLEKVPRLFTNLEDNEMPETGFYALPKSLEM